MAGLAILAALLHFLPISSLRATIGRVPAASFAAILVSYLLAHCVGVAKWRMVVNSAGSDLSIGTSTQCYAGGLFGALFLPSILGGDVIRLAVGLRRSPRPAAVVAGNVVDRILDAAAQGTLVLSGLILLPNSVPSQFQGKTQKALLWLAGAAIFLAATAYLARRPLFGGRSTRFRRRLARVRHALRSVSQRPHILALGWLMGICIQAALLHSRRQDGDILWVGVAGQSVVVCVAIGKAGCLASADAGRHRRARGRACGTACALRRTRLPRVSRGTPLGRHHCKRRTDRRRCGAPRAAIWRVPKRDVAHG